MPKIISPLDGFVGPFGIRDGGVDFNPASLFSGDEPGIWLDPSDTATVFQDVSGTTPSGDGDLVGLILDKSRGLAEGSELITNGDFASGITGWTGSAGVTLSHSSGELRVVATGTGQTFYSSGFSVVIGDLYKVQIDITGDASYADLRFEFRRTSDITGSAISTQHLVDVTTSPQTLTFYIRSNETQADAALLCRVPSALGINVDNVSVKNIEGRHAVRTADANKPTLRVVSGLTYLEFDGGNDGLTVANMSPSTDKMQCFLGVERSSDASTAILVEHSVNSTSNNGTFYITAPEGTDGFKYRSRGTNNVDAAATIANYPVSTAYVVAALGDISGDTAELRIDGAQADISTANQGTGNYTDQPIYIGQRQLSTLPFDGKLFGLLLRFGPNLSTSEISSAEGYMADKAGVTL